MTPTVSSPDIGVVCVTYNSEAHLREALSPLGELPVVVVDNASADSSAAVARECDTTVHILAENVGFGRAANLGVALLPDTVDMVAFVNPDLIVTSQQLRDLASTLQHNVNIGVVAPRLVFADGTPQYSGRPFPSFRRLLARALSGFDVRRDLGSDCRPDWVIGAAMVVRRDEFRQLGGFDSRFFLYYEDADLCCRYRSRALSVLVSSDVTAVHHYGRSSRRKLDVRQRAVRLHWLAIIKLALKYPVDFLS